MCPVASIYKPVCTLNETRQNGVDWFNLGQNAQNWLAFVNGVNMLQVPQNPGNFLVF